jgi:hypothetical protein
MSEPFDANLPVETFFRRIEECVDFAAAGNTPFSPQQVVNQAFYTVQKSGFFTDDCREWKRLPVGEKTWNRFKEHFSRAYHELKEATNTTQTGGFTANNVLTSDPMQALNNLANAAVADKETMASLTATISSLSQQLATANAKLTQERHFTASLQQEIQKLKDNGKFPRSTVTYDKYCWTHGIKCGHTSKSCTRRAEGHQEETTEENMMGGRTTKWRTGRK